MKSYEEISKELDAKIPREVIQSRDAGQGRRLDYLAGWYVIDRLNKVLGAGNWAYSSEASLVHSGILSFKSGDTHSVHYLAKVRLVITLGGKNTEFTDYGYGDGSDKSNPGKAHELAVKEAITDGLKRCAKNLGMSFGLALYSKDQENVDEGQPEVKRSSEPNPGIASKAAGASIPVRSGPSPVTPISPKVSEGPKQGSPRETLNKKITELSRVILAKKITSKEDLLKLFTPYGVTEKEQLTDEQAREFAGKLEDILK